MKQDKHNILFRGKGDGGEKKYGGGVLCIQFFGKKNFWVFQFYFFDIKERRFYLQSDIFSSSFFCDLVYIYMLVFCMLTCTCETNTGIFFSSRILTETGFICLLFI